MIELAYFFKGRGATQEILVRLHGVQTGARCEQLRAVGHPGDVLWAGKVAFDRALAGADPLHAVELAASFAQRYLRGRAQDEGGELDPPIAAPAA